MNLFHTHDDNLERLFHPPYLLLIKMTNYNSNEELDVSVGPTLNFDDLPRSLRDVLRLFPDLHNYCNVLPFDHMCHVSLELQSSIDNNSLRAHRHALHTGLYFFKQVRVATILSLLEGDASESDEESEQE